MFDSGIEEGSSSRGQYDNEFLDYLRKLLISMNEHGIVAYVVSPVPLDTQELTITGDTPGRVLALLRRGESLVRGCWAVVGVRES